MWFGCAAVAAVAAVLALRAHVASLEATRPDVGPPTAVVAAAADLTRGSILDAGSLSIVNVPSTLVPPGSLTSPEEASGRVLAADLAEGEILTQTRLSGAGSGPVAALVPAGLRAFVLPAGPPAGTVRSGDEIDVLATYGANAGRPYTETVAPGIESRARLAARAIRSTVKVSASTTIGGPVIVPPLAPAAGGPPSTTSRTSIPGATVSVYGRPALAP